MGKMTQKNQKKSSAFSPESQEIYSKILHLIWNEQSEDALTLLADTLSQKKTSHETAFLLYRTWIEVLAEQKEFGSLRLLINHLRSRNAIDHEAKTTTAYSASWASLEALIHLELDEMEASAVFKARLENEKNTYALEFLTRLSWRKDSEFKKQKLSILEDSHKDYWSLKTFALAADLAKEDLLANQLFLKINHLYPKNPLSLEKSYYTFLNAHSYGMAQEISHTLCLKFPEVASYAFLRGHAFFMDKKFPEAIESFQKAGDKIFQDPDMLATLGCCHFYQSKVEKQAEHWKKSVEFYTKAQALYKNMNFPTAELDLTLDFLAKEAQVKDFSKTKNQNFWLASLSSINSYDLLSTHPEESEYLFRKVDKKTQPGDMFFFIENVETSSNAPSPHQYKMVATYLAVNAPSYDPLKGWVSPLQLMSIKERRVSVKIEIQEKERKKSFAREELLELKKEEAEMLLERFSAQENQLQDLSINCPLLERGHQTKEEGLRENYATGFSQKKPCF